MTASCTACRHLDEPSDGPHCGPCKGYSGFEIVQPLVRVHPPSAPYTDTQRLDWMLPLVTSLDDPARVGDARTMALAAALLNGKRGRDAIDYAMEGSP